MDSITGQETVSYNSAGTLSIGSYSGGLSTTTGGTMNTANYYDYWYQPYYPIYYPSVHFITDRSKVDVAFKIIAKLLERKVLIKEPTVKEFIKMVNDIAEIL